MAVLAGYTFMSHGVKLYSDSACMENFCYDWININESPEQETTGSTGEKFTEGWTKRGCYDKICINEYIDMHENPLINDYCIDVGKNHEKVHNSRMSKKITEANINTPRSHSIFIYHISHLQHGELDQSHIKKFFFQVKRFVVTPLLSNFSQKIPTKQLI